jgi:hypothetical protein
MLGASATLCKGKCTNALLKLCLTALLPAGDWSDDTGSRWPGRMGHTLYAVIQSRRFPVELHQWSIRKQKGEFQCNYNDWCLGGAGKKFGTVVSHKSTVWWWDKHKCWRNDERQGTEITYNLSQCRYFHPVSYMPCLGTEHGTMHGQWSVKKKDVRMCVHNSVPECLMSLLGVTVWNEPRLRLLNLFLASLEETK